jgi:hypothetical protein
VVGEAGVREGISLEYRFCVLLTPDKVVMAVVKTKPLSQNKTSRLKTKPQVSLEYRFCVLLTPAKVVMAVVKTKPLSHVSTSKTKPQKLTSKLNLKPASSIAFECCLHLAKW